MPKVPIAAFPTEAYVPTQVSLRIKNGNHVDAGSQSVTMTEANRIVAYRGEEVCSFSQRISAIESGSGVSWRCAYHSSTHVRYLWVRFEYAMIDAGGGTDMHVKALVENAAGTDLGTATLRYSPLGTPPLDTPNEFGSAIVPLLDTSGEMVSPLADTDYFITISHENNGRLIACCIYEESLEPTTANGYLESGVAAKGEIYADHRADLIPLLRNAWKRNAGPLWLWAASDVAAITRTSGTRANWIDQTITTPSTASPGVTLDLRYKSTDRRVTVPCRWWIYAKMAAGIAEVVLSTVGAPEIEVINITSSTAAWYSATINLPAAEDKYELMIAGNGASLLTIYASSLLQYEA